LRTNKYLSIFVVLFPLLTYYFAYKINDYENSLKFFEFIEYIKSCKSFPEKYL